MNSFHRSGVPDYGPITADFDKNTGSFRMHEIPDVKFDRDSLEILSTVRFDPKLVKTKPKSAYDLTSDMLFLWDLHMSRLQKSLDFFRRYGNIKPQEIDVEEDPNKLKPEEQFWLDGERIVIDKNIIFGYIKQAFIDGEVSTEKSLKLRLLVKINGEVTIECHPTPERPNLMIGLTENYPEELLYDIYVDRTPVVVSPFTSFKTTKRDVYNAARNRALPGKSALEEVLLVNSTHELMEGSIFNVAIESEDGNLLTPELDSGCLCGVTRQKLILDGIIHTSEIMDFDLLEGHEVYLFNGIVGVAKGIIRGFVGSGQTRPTMVNMKTCGKEAKSEKALGSSDREELVQNLAEQGEINETKRKIPLKDPKKNSAKKKKLQQIERTSVFNFMTS